MCVRATELLADGKWHDYNEVRRELMSLIPAAVAIRKNERDRAYYHRRRDGPDARISPRVRPLSEERRILAGRKSITRDFLRMRTFERNDRCGPSGPIRQIRMVHVPKRARYAEASKARLAAAREEQRQAASEEESNGA